ncbi:MULTISPECIES: hypothetical protein [Pontibacter]|uniref:hypothetical protein n=1 Tax=Pontibacter TaxID=323449 RepID=UPI00164E1AC2|nr:MULTISPECIES: hypothetical protein [Pontibacter]
MSKKWLKTAEMGFLKKSKKITPVFLLLENSTHNFAPELREIVDWKANIGIKN